jgi:hypothetical protein
VAPRSGSRGHADEGIRGVRRPGGGGGDGQVDPPYPVRTGDGDLSTNNSSVRRSSHGCLAVVAGGGGGGRGKEGFGGWVLSSEVGECFEQFGALWERKGGDDDAVRHFLGSPHLSIWASGPLFSWTPDSFLWPPAQTAPKSFVHNT